MKPKFFFPLMLALAMAFGFWLGTGMRNPLVVERASGGWQKIDEILSYVENDYVDTISRQKLEDEVVAYLLQRLDPHSYYIEENRVQAFNEPLDGGFEGIGVQFRIRNDSVYVISTVDGGPAQKAGIKASDRILTVDGELIAGNGITNARVMKLLKGTSGSSVAVEVKRLGSEEPIEIVIERGEIPLTSIDAVYKVDSTTLYVRLARFARTTEDEFKQRVVPYAGTGITNVVLDLRGNGGGFLDAATYLADEFLKKGLLITYTEGRSRPRQEYKATSTGHFEDTRLFLLMDGYSASASEILAGAVQDHGRGLIIGKRSFGKGLVQEQNEWPDGSATRLTVARYFTPNGRSIQRPYETLPETNGDDLNVSNDSAQVGGIEPDIIVSSDTASLSWLYAEVVHRGLLNDFAYDYRDRSQQQLAGVTAQQFLSVPSVEEMKAALKTYLEGHAVVIDEKDWKKSADHMTVRAKAILGRALYGEDIYFRLINAQDPSMKLVQQEIKKSEV